MKVVANFGAKSPVGWLAFNDVLVVLAISNVRSEGSKYLIWSDEQRTAALFPAADFEIVDATLSRRWVAGLDGNGFVHLGPSEWQVDGFWEKFHDGATHETNTFEREMTAMLIE